MTRYDQYLPSDIDPSTEDAIDRIVDGGTLSYDDARRLYAVSLGERPASVRMAMNAHPSNGINNTDNPHRGYLAATETLRLCLQPKSGQISA